MLRATVTDAVRCLSDLSSAQRRVLALRAGIGAGPPRSRGGVAKRLRISERRVVRLERTGLRRLRTLDRKGACAPPHTATAADVAPRTGATALLAAAGSGDRARSDGDGGGGSDPARSHRDSGGREKPGDGGAVEVPPVGGVAGESATNRPGGGIELTLPLILLCLAAVAVVLARTLRRNATPAAPLGATSAEPPRPVWVPWHRSTMRGPGWNDPRPPSDRAEEWSDSPPPREPEHHAEWTPPTRRITSRR